MTNVIYVSEIKGNFLTIRALTKKGFTVLFYNDLADISINGKVIIRAKIKNELFKYCENLCNIKEIKNKIGCINFHRLLGHRNIDSIKRMINDKMIKRIQLKSCHNCKLQCEICIESKMTRKKFCKEKKKTTKEPLELIHTDICGPMRTLTNQKYRYILTFIDDY